MKLSFFLLSLASLAVPAFAMTAAAATPEPATFLLIGTGLTSVGVIAWRRNRKK